MSTKTPPLTPELRLAGGLADPVKVLSSWLIVSTGLVLVALTLPWVLIAYEVGRDYWVVGVILAFVYILVACSLPLAMWLVVCPARRQPVFYLRAFKSDEHAASLRQLLRSALGQSYRLCGIRPPRERVSWASRLLLTTATGFRYVGSDHFELEAADHNWMARLLVSCAKARFIFIDVSEVTQHVADEIRLSYLAMGAPRCIFIIDDQNPETTWRACIADLVGDPAAATKLVLLAYSGEGATNEEPFVRAAHEVIKQVPAGLADTSAALEFVRSRVRSEAWRTPLREKDWAQFYLGGLIVAAVFLPINFALKKFFGPYAAMIPAAAITLVFLFFYLRALGRTRRETRFQAQFRSIIGGRDPRSRARNATALTVFWVFVLLFSLVSIPALSRAKDRAQSILCVNNMKQIEIAFKTWALDNEDQFPFNVRASQGGTMEACAAGRDGYDLNSFRHLQVMSNELVQPGILICPLDTSRFPATVFAELQATNVSYLVRSGTNVVESNPQEALLVCPFHGHKLLTDGTISWGHTRPSARP